MRRTEIPVDSIAQTNLKRCCGPKTECPFYPTHIQTTPRLAVRLACPTRFGPRLRAPEKLSDACFTILRAAVHCRLLWSINRILSIGKQWGTPALQHDSEATGLDARTRA